MGRSRGGLTSKIHALVDGKGRPLALLITAGQVHDAPACEPLLQLVRKGQTVLGDKAYDAKWIRDMIAGAGAKANIPPQARRKNPADYDRELYKKRHKIECFFGRLKRSFRAIATRYDKYSTNYLAGVKLAAVRLWCGWINESAT